MDRSEILQMMAALQLSGMRAAYDEIVTTGIKRKHSIDHIIASLLKAEIAYTINLRPGDDGPREIALGLTGTNLLDDDVRNHVSFKKDEVLMPGRSVRAFARLRF